MPNLNNIQLTAAEIAALDAARKSAAAPHGYANSAYYKEEYGRAFEAALRAHIKNGRRVGVWRTTSGGDTFNTTRAKLYCGKAWLEDNTKDPELLAILPHIRLRTDKHSQTIKLTEQASSGAVAAVNNFSAFETDVDNDLAHLKESFVKWAETSADGDLFDVTNLDLTPENIAWFCERRDELGLIGRIERTRVMIAMVKGVDGNSAAPDGDPNNNFQV